MDHFGATDHVSRGAAYEGTASERMFRYAASDKGPLLRSLTRTSMTKAVGLRVPTNAPDGFAANNIYVLKMLSLVPALHAPEILYHRWNQRPGGRIAGNQP